MLVYSTCTFAPEENEQAIEAFLERNSDFVIDSIELPFGHKCEVCGGYALRIYPMDGGEGHFVARMKRINKNVPKASFAMSNETVSVDSFVDDIFSDAPPLRFNTIGEHLYAMPKDMPDVYGQGILRAGILAGKIKRGRIEPCHALFMAFPPNLFKNTVDLTDDQMRLAAFLRGEEIAVSDRLRGYTAVVFENMTIGFGKCTLGRLKNHYPKGLRNLK